MDDLKRIMSESDYHNLKLLSQKLKDDREHFWLSFKNNLHKHLRITNDAMAKIDQTLIIIKGLLGEK